MQSADGSFPLHYYGLIVGVYVVHQGSDSIEKIIS